MLAEYDHFPTCIERNVVLKIHIDRIVYAEFPDLRSFREGLVVDGVKERDFICFC